MDMVSQRDLISTILGAPASAFAPITAGGAGDNAAVVGLPIDRSQFGYALASVFRITAQATLAAAATLTVKGLLVEHSADGANWLPYLQVPDFGVVLTGPAVGGTVRTALHVNCPLREAKQFVRFTFTPDLSAANTDTALLVACVTFAGFDRLPPAPGSAA